MCRNLEIDTSSGVDTTSVRKGKRETSRRRSCGIGPLERWLLVAITGSPLQGHLSDSQGTSPLTALSSSLPWISVLLYILQTQSEATGARSCRLNPYRLSAKGEEWTWRGKQKIATRERSGPQLSHEPWVYRFLCSRKLCYIYIITFMHIYFIMPKYVYTHYIYIYMHICMCVCVFWK